MPETEEIKEMVFSLAKTLGIKNEEITKAYEKFKADLQKRNVSEDKLEKLTWARLKNALKRKLVIANNLELFRGFIIGRTRTFDRSRRAREEAQEFINTHGLEKAIEAGYASPDGNLLYVSPPWRAGTPIPENDYGAQAVGVFQIDGEWRVCSINLKGDAAVANLPLFKIATYPAYVRSEDRTKVPLELTISKVPMDISEKQVDINDFIDVFEEQVPDRIIKDYDFEDFIVTHSDEFSAWCIFEADVMGITPVKNGGCFVNVDFSVDQYDIDDVKIGSVFFPEQIPVNFIDDALDVVFVVSPYYNSEGDIRLTGLGYWADEIYQKVGEEEDINFLNPWG